MKITPLEIRQKSFEKKLRGYDKDEVEAFLLSLSNEWERVLDEKKELTIKLEQSEKEVQKLREVESSLFKTLKTAEDTGANLIDQANKAAELHLKETQMNADAMMGEAKSKAKAIIEKSEAESRMIIEELQQAVKDLQQNYRTLENQRDNLIAELKTLADDIHERIGRTSKQKHKFDLEDHTKKVKALVRESEERLGKEQFHVKPVKMKPIDESKLNKPTQTKTVASNTSKKQVARKPSPKSTPKKSGGSFFDELEE